MSKPALHITNAALSNANMACHNKHASLLETGVDEQKNMHPDQFKHGISYADNQENVGEHLSVVKLESATMTDTPYKNLSSDNVIDKKTMDLMLESFLQAKNTAPIDQFHNTAGEEPGIKIEQKFDVTSFSSSFINAVIDLKCPKSETSPLDQEKTLPFDQSETTPVDKKDEETLDIKFEPIFNLNKDKDPEDKNVLETPNSSETISFDHNKVKASYSRGKQKSLKSDTNDMLFRCQRCPEVFSQELLLKQHEEQHIYDEENPFKCKNCGKAFPLPTELKRHELKHLSDEKLFEPRKRKKRFTYVHKYKVDNDNGTYHNLQEENRCSICKKTFTRIYYLRVHEENHKRKKVIHKCDICYKTFKTFPGLNNHCKVHLGKNVKCTHCPRMFGNKTTLKMHWDAKHLPYIRSENTTNPSLDIQQQQQ